MKNALKRLLLLNLTLILIVSTVACSNKKVETSSVDSKETIALAQKTVAQLDEYLNCYNSSIDIFEKSQYGYSEITDEEIEKIKSNIEQMTTIESDMIANINHIGDIVVLRVQPSTSKTDFNAITQLLNDFLMQTVKNSTNNKYNKDKPLTFDEILQQQASIVENEDKKLNLVLAGNISNLSEIRNNIQLYLDEHN